MPILLHVQCSVVLTKGHKINEKWNGIFMQASRLICAKFDMDLNEILLEDLNTISLCSCGSQERLLVRQFRKKGKKQTDILSKT